MSVSGEQILRAVVVACERTGVRPLAEDVRDRRRLEAELERELRPLACECGGFDWGDE